MSSIPERIAARRYWYHKIKLPDGTTTPGMNLEPIWENIRSVRSLVPYAGTRVLDIASFDGLWAFEAEERGAAEVVATDCLYNTFGNLLLIREILQSSVVPYFNVSPYNLSDRLDIYFEENFESKGQHSRRFDIVQHLGLLYHLRDPLWSLSQARSVLKTGGKFLFEGEVILDREDSSMVFNGLPGTTRIRDNVSVWWSPTIPCLHEMLRASFLEPDLGSQSVIEFEVPVSAGGSHAAFDQDAGLKRGRLAIWATATEPDRPIGKWQREMLRTFRNPGLDVRRLGWSDLADGAFGFATE
jgi:tRNA (mo5U34)-methyltransferase